MDDLRFAPDGRFTAGAVLGAVVAALVCAFGPDAYGRLLAGIAAVVLAAYAIGDLVFRPRLTASPAGLVVWSPLTRASLAWSDIEDVRADTRSRLGVHSTTLEIDAGATLAVLTRRTLNADPVEVAAAVNAFRPT